MTASKFMTGAEQAKEASKQVQFDKTHYWGIEDGKQDILRFLTEGNAWRTVQKHGFVPTKAKPEGYEGNWPQKMSAVCRKTKLANGETLFDDCYICDHMEYKDKEGKTKKYSATARTYVLACRREEVREDGKVVGWRDATREIAEVDKEGKPTGGKRIEKDIVVVNQGWQNFFSTLEGYYGMFETLLDRDFMVRRSGGGTDTTYTIAPLTPIEGLDLRDPEIMARYQHNIDLDEIIEGQASDDYYARFFDPTKTASNSKGSSNGDSPPAAEKPSNDVDEERLRQMRERVTGYGAQGDQGGTEGGETAAPAPAASGGGMKDFG